MTRPNFVQIARTSEKADTHGCLYCCSHNIHHPQYCYSFQNGGEHHWKTLCSKIDEIIKYLLGRFSDPGLEYLGIKPPEVTIARYAYVALCRFNGEQGTNFELVKIGAPPAIAGLRIGFVKHLNFEAENKDDPDAAVQTFFAEILQSYNYFIVDFCKCLGLSFLLPDEAELRGCVYCKSCIHHPPGPGYLVGRESGPPEECKTWCNYGPWF